ncbi:DEAD/DEAH box helicase [Leptotrichia buccalis]
MNKFPQYDLEYISGRMSLRSPQKESLKILDNILNNIKLSKNIDIEEAKIKINSLYPIFSDFERNFVSLAFVLATGVGKTRLMGTFITYLYTNYNIKNFFVVAPNKTIYNKLKQDLGNPSNPKYVFKGIDCFVVNPPKIYSDEDYRNKNMELFSPDVKIFVYNIGKFSIENAKMRAVNEYLGNSFFDELSKMEDLVLIMDESHHYHGEKGALALNELKPLLGLELTATPYYKIKSKQEKFKNAVYEYPLSKSINDGYTRTPYAVTRQDIHSYNFGDEELDKMMISDGIICHKKIKLELEYYAKNNGKPKVKPFTMIVCKDTEHATSIFEYVTSDDFMNGEYKAKTLVIHSNQSKAKREENIEKLLSVESYDNPIEIVIHVDMLKEGWDVNNLYTIVPLRTASSKILREQMVGRGLRLPYGTRTGVKEIDSVMLTAHSKFDEILKEAQKGDSIFKEGNVIKVEEIGKENISLAQLEIKFPKEEIKKIFQDMEIEETVENEYFIEKIQENIKKEIFEEVKNDNISNKNNVNIKGITQKIEKKIDASKDLFEIYNGNNKTLFNNFIEKQIEEIVTKTFEKFIPVPQIKVNDSGITEYRIVDFDLELEEFNHVPIENDLIIQNLKDMRDREIINNENKYISFSDFNPRKELITELRKKPEIDYENYSELLFKLIDQVLNHYINKYNQNEMKIFMYIKEYLKKK